MRRQLIVVAVLCAASPAVAQDTTNNVILNSAILSASPHNAVMFDTSGGNNSVITLSPYNNPPSAPVDLPQASSTYFTTFWLNPSDTLTGTGGSPGSQEVIQSVAASNPYNNPLLEVTAQNIGGGQVSISVGMSDGTGFGGNFAAWNSPPVPWNTSGDNSGWTFFAISVNTGITGYSADIAYMPINGSGMAVAPMSLTGATMNTFQVPWDSFSAWNIGGDTGVSFATGAAPVSDNTFAYHGGMAQSLQDTTVWQPLTTGLLAHLVDHNGNAPGLGVQKYGEMVGDCAVALGFVPNTCNQGNPGTFPNTPTKAPGGPPPSRAKTPTCLPSNGLKPVNGGMGDPCAAKGGGGGCGMLP